MSKHPVEPVKIEGWVEIIVRDKNGKIKYYMGPKNLEELDDPAPFLSSLPAKFQDFYWRKNIITNAGLAAIIRLVFSGLTETKFGYIAIGTGTTAEAATDTALVAEIKRKSATVSQTTTSVSGDTALLTATFSNADGLTGTSNVA